MLTLEQLYNLGKAYHIDIFSGITLPANSPINRTVLIDTILERCGMNYPMYADPNIMLSAINVWSARNQYTFEHVAKIINADYSPIENKDYIEETITSRDRALTDNTTGSNNKTEKLDNKFEEGTNTHQNEEHSGTDTTTDTTSAYNASDYQPDNKTDMQHGEKIATGVVTDHNTISSGSKTTNTGLTTNKDVDELENTSVKTHQHGNIGITSPFQLQESEYTLLKDYNPYVFLSDIFEKDLTLCVY